jgi:hypothetical protein
MQRYSVGGALGIHTVAATRATLGWAVPVAAARAACRSSAGVAGRLTRAARAPAWVQVAGGAGRRRGRGRRRGGAARRGEAGAGHSGRVAVGCSCCARVSAFGPAWTHYHRLVQITPHHAIARVPHDPFTAWPPHFTVPPVTCCRTGAGRRGRGRAGGSRSVGAVAGCGGVHGAQRADAGRGGAALRGGRGAGEASGRPGGWAGLRAARAFGSVPHGSCPDVRCVAVSGCGLVQSVLATLDEDDASRVKAEFGLGLEGAARDEALRERAVQRQQRRGAKAQSKAAAAQQAAAEAGAAQAQPSAPRRRKAGEAAVPTAPPEAGGVPAEGMPDAASAAAAAPAVVRTRRRRGTAGEPAPAAVAGAATTPAPEPPAAPAAPPQPLPPLHPLQTEASRSGAARLKVMRPASVASCGTPSIPTASGAYQRIPSRLLTLLAPLPTTQLGEPFTSTPAERAVRRLEKRALERLKQNVAASPALRDSVDLDGLEALGGAAPARSAPGYSRKA